MVRLERILTKNNLKIYVYLHSSMVRLESLTVDPTTVKIKKFTFQYGQIRKFIALVKSITFIQIYIPVWLDQKESR